MKIKYLLLLIFLYSTGNLYSQLIKPKLIGPPGDNSISQIFIDQMNSDNIFMISTFGGAQASFDNLATIVPFGPTDSNFPPPELVYVSHNSPGNIYLNFSNQFLVSMDYGETWVTKIDKNLNGEFMGVNPQNSAHLFLVEKDTVLIESFDHGDSFKKVLTLPGQSIGGIEFAPADTNIVYACTSGGLLKSTNGGIDWFIVNAWKSNSKIIINPKNPDTIIFDNDYYLNKSVDGGKTIFRLNENMMEEFIINPIDTSIYYAIRDDTDAGIYKSTDAGQTWFKISKGYTNGASTLAIYPDNPNVILAAVPTLGIFKSTDAGKSWVYTDKPYSFHIYDVFVKPENPGTIFSFHIGWGMRYTTNFGTTWEYMIVEDQNPTGKTFGDLQINPFNNNEWYLNGSPKNGKNNLISTDQGKSWNYIEIPSPLLDFYFHPTIPNIRFGVWYYYDMFYQLEELYRSTDSGQSYELLGELPIKLLFNPFDENYIITVGFEEFWQSTDLGYTWTENPGNGLIQYSAYEGGGIQEISQIVFSTNESNVLYCGQNTINKIGGISKSTDLGETWFRIDNELIKLDRLPYRINIYLDDRQNGRIYVGMVSGLYLTENDGGSWRKIYNGQVYGIYGDDFNPRNIYFTSAYGIMTFVDTLTVTSNEDIVNTLPDNFMLYQNYPNPFNPVTKIKYSIPGLVETRLGLSQQQVTLKIFDILGREVATLVNEYKKPGTYEAEFNASHLASGVYIAKLTAGELSQSRKIMLLK